jgi:hypothetical protein
MPADTSGPPLPEPLRGNESGTWAEETVKERMPDIGRRAIDEREWPLGVRDALMRLVDDLPSGVVSIIDDPGAPDEEAWRKHVAPYEGMTWLDVPWFFAEAYFYRRMLAASGYFREGPTRGLDPFGPEKRRGLARGLGEDSPSDGRAGMDDLLLAALWGNRADMSIWPTQDSEAQARMDTDAAGHLLVDDRPAVLAHLQSIPGGPKRVDVVLDNAGKELLADLALVRGIIDTWETSRIVLHVKPHPMFVSDAMQIDLDWTLSQAAAAGGSPAEMSTALDAARRAGRLDVTTDDFWTSPLPGWEMPENLISAFADSDLTIFKGDANYRRLLGDRHWPYATPFADILAYFPAPILCLRTLKAEIVSGLDNAATARAALADQDWMIDGRWAVIQFATHAL